jgi:DNA-binding beta-propeller fold protein YncE
MQVTRRDCLLLSSFALASSCSSRKRIAFPGYALIATSGEKSLGAVDLANFQALSPIPLDSEPSAVLPGGPGGNVYVLTPNTGSVHAVSSGLKYLGRKKLSEQLISIVLSGSGKSLLAISPQHLIESDPRTLQVLRRIPLPSTPSYLTAWGDYAAISLGRAGIVQVFQLRTGKSWSAQLGGPLGILKFRDDGKLLIVANLGARELAALSIPGLDVIARLPLAMEPRNLCANRDGGQFFVSGDGMDGVAILFPYRVLEIDQTVLAGRDPGVMAASANPDLLFVGSNSGSDVCILNIESRKVVGIVDVEQRPSFITVTPDNQFALILNAASNDMAVVRVPTIRLNPAIVISKSGASLFTMLSVGAKPVHAAVIPKPA